MKVTKLICDHCGSDKDVKLRKVQVGFLPASFYPETIQYMDMDLCEECARFIEYVVGNIAEDESYLTKKQVLSVILQLLGKEDVKDFFNKQKDLRVFKEHKKEVTATFVNGNIKLGPFTFKNDETKYLLITPGSERVVLPWKDAVKYCDSKNRFLPTKDELNLIIQYKDLIDSVDPSTIGKFSDIGDGWIWSSSEYNPGIAWVQRPSGGYHVGGNKFDDYWVVPFRRVLS